MTGNRASLELNRPFVYLIILEAKKCVFYRGFNLYLDFDVPYFGRVIGILPGQI